MENEMVRPYLARHAPEIVEQFELVLNTVSMEEAVEQVEQEDGQNAADATTHACTAKDNKDAASALRMHEQLG